MCYNVSPACSAHLIVVYGATSFFKQAHIMEDRTTQAHIMEVRTTQAHIMEDRTTQAHIMEDRTAQVLMQDRTAQVLLHTHKKAYKDLIKSSGSFLLLSAHHLPSSFSLQQQDTCMHASTHTHSYSHTHTHTHTATVKWG